jgi:hypothetical protein
VNGFAVVLVEVLVTAGSRGWVASTTFGYAFRGGGQLGPDSCADILTSKVCEETAVQKNQEEDQQLTKFSIINENKKENPNSGLRSQIKTSIFCIIVVTIVITLNQERTILIVITSRAAVRILPHYLLPRSGRPNHGAKTMVQYTWYARILLLHSHS